MARGGVSPVVLTGSGRCLSTSDPTTRNVLTYDLLIMTMKKLVIEFMTILSSLVIRCLGGEKVLINYDLFYLKSHNFVR